MNFDADRKGTGTKEWSEHTENICRGCPNNCRYCYAAHNANRFGQRYRDQWQDEVLTKRAHITSYPKREGVVMFPSSHDITPFNVEAYIRVAKLILDQGNRLLIVSKPRLDCIERLLAELKPWKEQILFRFTIGTIREDVSEFWEPGAPKPLERFMAMALAQDNGFRVSVSIEPMLGGTDDTLLVVGNVRIDPVESIWIGKMNKARSRVDSAYSDAVAQIEQLQRDSEIMRLYHELKHGPDIRWKDSIKEVVARAL